MTDARWRYLDHAATTPTRPEVVEAMLPLLRDGFGNPSGAHALARQARTALDGARALVAAAVGAGPGDVVFTSGGTEADNLALRGVTDAAGGRPVCTAVEHDAVLEVVRSLGGTVVGVHPSGLVDLDQLADALADDVSIVSVQLVNNEVGAVQPLDEVVALVRERAPGAVVHTDAAQALCWLDVAAAVQGVDLVTLASHKCGGPKGTGALVARPGVTLVPQVLGGGQERERRSGTQDVAGAVGFATAARAAQAERAELVERATAWRDELVGALTGVDGAVVSADPARTGLDHVVPGIVNVCFPGVDSEALLFLLEQEHQLLASAASSCASGAQGPSHVLAAMGMPMPLSQGSLRLSMGWCTTPADVAAAAVGVPEVVRRLQRHARDGAPA